MTVNLVKLCVGAQSIEDLARWQKSRRAHDVSHPGHARLVHTTHQTPKRQAELLDGGSLYWVIKGVIEVRQRIIGLDEGKKESGQKCCLIVLDPLLVPVRPAPRRAFQGWRYLDAADAPPDFATGSADETAAMPARMRRDLAELGLI